MRVCGVQSNQEFRYRVGLTADWVVSEVVLHWHQGSVIVGVDAGGHRVLLMVTIIVCVL